MFISGKRRRKRNPNRDKNNLNRGGDENGDGGVEEGLNPFITRDEETATPWLPEHLHRRLALRLKRELFGKGGVRFGVEEDLDQYESAFEFAPAPDRFVLFSVRCPAYWLLVFLIHFKIIDLEFNVAPSHLCKTFSPIIILS